MINWFRDKLGRIWYWSKKKVRWVLVGTITAATALGLILAPAPIPTDMETQMQRINVVGERHIAIFDCDSIQVTEFSSDTDYNERFIDLQIGEKPNPPIRDGCKWVSSSRSTHFDTVDGFIHPGEYATSTENNEGRVFFMLPDGKFENWSKEEVEMLKIISDTDL